MSAYYNEFDPLAAAWLRELIKEGHIADGEVDERSILDVRPDDLRGFRQCHFFAGIGGWSLALRLAGIPDEFPVWTGSPPCQPFSAAGKQLGRNDPRHLAPHFIGMVGAARPSVLFGEQVASSDVFGKATGRSGKTAAIAPQWAWLDDLSDRLEAARYAVGADDIPAAGIGAPHIRQRTFFGAVRLPDADRRERIGIADGEGRQPNRQAPGWQQGDGEPKCSGASDGLANDISVGWDRWRAGKARHEPRAQQRPNGFREAGGLATGGLYLRPRPNYSPWASVDWLGCRDGFWRPVEPGTFPLAHGVPARVGRLRGYGNAIVPQVAAEFIVSFLGAFEEVFG